MEQTAVSTMVFGAVATVAPTITFSTFPAHATRRAPGEAGVGPVAGPPRLRLVE